MRRPLSTAVVVAACLTLVCAAAASVLPTQLQAAPRTTRSVDQPLVCSFRVEGRVGRLPVLRVEASLSPGRTGAAPRSRWDFVWPDPFALPPSAPLVTSVSYAPEYPLGPDYVHAIYAALASTESVQAASAHTPSRPLLENIDAVVVCGGLEIASTRNLILSAHDIWQQLSGAALLQDTTPILGAPACAPNLVQDALTAAGQPPDAVVLVLETGLPSRTWIERTGTAPTSWVSMTAPGMHAQWTSILLAPAYFLLHRDKQVGVLAHELGHILGHTHTTSAARSGHRLLNAVMSARVEGIPQLFHRVVLPPE